MMNTVIEKNDGSYWICGEGVGTEQKTVSGETEYTVTCSSKIGRASCRERVSSPV